MKTKKRVCRCLKSGKESEIAHKEVNTHREWPVQPFEKPCSSGGSEEGRGRGTLPRDRSMTRRHSASSATFNWIREWHQGRRTGRRLKPRCCTMLMDVHEPWTGSISDENFILSDDLIISPSDNSPPFFPLRHRSLSLMQPRNNHVYWYLVQSVNSIALDVMSARLVIGQ